MSIDLFSRSTRHALSLAVAYAVLAAGSISLSSLLASETAQSVDEVQRAETIKKIVLVGVTAVLVFVGALLALRRIERDGEELLRRERAIVAADGRVFTGLVAASTAHDANNVLVVVLAGVDDLAERVVGEGEVQIERLRTAVGRLIELNRRLMSAARDGAMRERQPVDVGFAVRETLVALRAHPLVRECRTRVVAEGEMVISLQPMHVHQVVTNLVLFAAESVAGHGTIEVRVQRSAHEIVVEVHDDGPGLAPERRALFDELRTSGDASSSLGLFAARACLEGLGGSIEADTSPLGGTRVRAHFPTQRAAALA
jgi:signal transduction histidine kinase